MKWISPSRKAADRNFADRLVRRFWIFTPEAIPHSWNYWQRQTQLFKKHFPIRYFLKEDLPHHFYQWVTQPLNRIRAWFRYRFSIRHHVVNTGLKPGYYDPDIRMMHSVFQILVDFVEIELSSMYHASQSAPQEYHKSVLPIFQKLYRKRTKKNQRYPEAGLSFLDNEMDLTSITLHPGIIKCPYDQGEAALEKKFLYLWWKVYRPQRIDPYSSNLIWGDNPDGSEDSAYHFAESLEAFYQQEDDEMLMRLLTVRSTMWC